MTIASGHRLAIADRTMIVDYLNGWSATVRIYTQAGVARRTLRCVDANIVQEVRRTFLATVFPLPDLQLSLGVEAILLDTERIGEAAIADKLRRLGEPIHFSVDTVEPVAVSVDVPAAPIAGYLPEAIPATTSAPVPSTVPAASRSASRVAGKLIEAGYKPSTVGQGKSFEAVLDIGGGATRKFRGVMLAELFTQLGVQVGETIAITPQGATPSTVPDRGTGKPKVITKNTFLVERETMS
jgi:hypothetical protein